MERKISSKPVDVSRLSPMMRQYWKVKEQYLEQLLFFRLGDFYELFFDDALIASRELELTLTGKECGLDERAPMCGIPYHSCENYIAKLVKKGYKVAICEQMEDPATAKGLVKREIIRVITPGTVLESNMLDAGSNNYLCLIFRHPQQGCFGVVFSDVSTGEVYA
ncbi:MAG: DNA mismatch repair protein MutS, partial [Negativibacillus sp.]